MNWFQDELGEEPRADQDRAWPKWAWRILLVIGCVWLGAMLLVVEFGPAKERRAAQIEQAERVP